MNMLRHCVFRIVQKVFIYVLSRLFSMYFFLCLRGKIIGHEHLPQSACILAMNHVSYLDWLILYGIFYRKYGIAICFLAKAKLLKNWLWRFLLTMTNTTTVDYDSIGSIKHAYRTLHGYLQEGYMVGIFPEGTRSPTGKLQEAKDGIAHIVLQFNVPVVPVGLIGFYEAWPRHQRLPRMGNAIINIGEPIIFRTSDYQDRKRAKRLMTTVIMQEIAKLTGDTYPYAEPIRTHKQQSASGHDRVDDLTE